MTSSAVMAGGMGLLSEPWASEWAEVPFFEGGVFPRCFFPAGLACIQYKQHACAMALLSQHNQ